MSNRFRYENPVLVGLLDDMSCRGAQCKNGFDISSSYCWAGSCVEWSMCGTGTAAEGCCSGTKACSVYYYGSCESGSGVSGACSTGDAGAASTKCVCSATGSYAGYLCTYGNNTLADGGSGGCGCGGNHGT